MQLELFLLLAINFDVFSLESYFVGLFVRAELQELEMVVDASNLFLSFPAVHEQLDENIAHQWNHVIFYDLVDTQFCVFGLAGPCHRNLEVIVFDVEVFGLNAHQLEGSQFPWDLLHAQNFFSVIQVPTLARLIDPISIHNKPSFVVEDQRSLCTLELPRI